MKAAPNGDNLIVVCHIHDGSHITNNIVLRLDKMKIFHATNTLLITQFTYNIEAGTMLRYAKLMR